MSRKKGLHFSSKKKFNYKLIWILIVLILSGVVYFNGTFLKKIYINQIIGQAQKKHNDQPVKIKSNTKKSPKPTSTAKPAKHPLKIDNSKITIKDPVITLDSNMDQHLKKFRSDVSQMARSNPDNFILHGPLDKQEIALTFDDMPSKLTTEKTINILKKYNIKGTFFIIGNRIQNNENLLKDIFNNGNEIGIHSWSHPRFTEINGNQLDQEINKTADLIETTVGVKSKYIRPPYGTLTQQQLDHLSTEGYKTVDWSIDSMDWYTTDKNLIIKSITDSIHNGAIILMHGNKGTIETLDYCIPHFQQLGYKFVKLSELLQ